MDKEEREREEAAQNKETEQNKRGSHNSSQQADTNLALTVLRHLQSRFHLNHNNNIHEPPGEYQTCLMFKPIYRVLNCRVACGGLQRLPDIAQHLLQREAG